MQQHDLEFLVPQHPPAEYRPYRSPLIECRQQRSEYYLHKQECRVQVARVQIEKYNDRPRAQQTASDDRHPRRTHQETAQPRTSNHLTVQTSSRESIPTNKPGPKSYKLHKQVHDETARPSISDDRTVQAPPRKSILQTSKARNRPNRVNKRAKKRVSWTTKKRLQIQRTSKERRITGTGKKSC